MSGENASKVKNSADCDNVLARLKKVANDADAALAAARAAVTAARSKVIHLQFSGASKETIEWSVEELNKAKDMLDAVGYADQKAFSEYLRAEKDCKNSKSGGRRKSKSRKSKRRSSRRS